MDISKIDVALTNWKTFHRLDAPGPLMATIECIYRELSKDITLSRDSKLADVKCKMEEVIPTTITVDDANVIKNRLTMFLQKVTKD